MSTKKKPVEKLIPFDADGHLIEEANKDQLSIKKYGGSPGNWTTRDELIDWRPNSEFTDTLRFVQLRGHRAIRADFLTSMDKQVSMFFDDFQDVIALLVTGTLQGTFTFTSHSAFYAVKLVS